MAQLQTLVRCPFVWLKYTVNSENLSIAKCVGDHVLIQLMVVECIREGRFSHKILEAFIDILLNFDNGSKLDGCQVCVSALKKFLTKLQVF